jgi:hypothetical protein
MRMPIKGTLDLCIAGIGMLLGILLDASMLSLFKAHLQRVPAISRYRPFYMHSGRRSRVRY